MHFGKREVLSRIEAMEVEYDEPLAYVDPGPAMPGDEPTGDPSQPWGDGIVVWGASQLQRCQQTPSLMADSYGFCGEEEWGRVQQYLKSHGRWQLEQVGITGKSARSLAIIYGHLPCYIIGRLLIGRMFHVPGGWHGQLLVCECEERPWREGGKQQEPSLLSYPLHAMAGSLLVGQQ